MRKLNLNILKTKLPGITEGQGYFLWEAALLCLVENNHNSGTIIQIKGKFVEAFQLIWEGEVTTEMKQNWGDVKEATEYGAMAIAILVILALTNFVILGRSRQGTSVDYFLTSSTSTLVFPEPDAALEVSGLLKETKGNTINMRINDKLRRLEKLGYKQLKTFVIVTEFGQPKTKIVQK